MKKVISFVLLCSMALICPVSVLANGTDADDKSYNLDELFMEYQEKSLDEMVEYISSSPYFKEPLTVEFFLLLCYNQLDKYEFGDNLLWLCGIRGEVVKNAVKGVCIAIYIRAMQSGASIRMRSK